MLGWDAFFNFHPAYCTIPHFVRRHTVCPVLWHALGREQPEMARVSPENVER
jgi:hypothetical protein